LRDLPPVTRRRIPRDGQLESVAVSNGVATVQFSANLDPLPRAGQGQIVYTLTQFPTITTVDGKPLSAPATRNDLADLTANAAIFVAEPMRDSTVSSPVPRKRHGRRLRGAFAVDVWSGGKLLRTQTIQATSGTGTRGTWSRQSICRPGRPGSSSTNRRPRMAPICTRPEVDLTVQLAAGYNAAAERRSR